MSEQDFFFEEEPDAKSSSTKGSKAPKAPVTTPSKSSAAAPTPVSASSDDSTTWSVAALIGVVGLLLGAILGFVLGMTVVGNSASSTSLTPAPITGTQPAPQLTTEQISAGELPAGHPSVSPSGSGDTTPAK